MMRSSYLVMNYPFRIPIRYRDSGSQQSDSVKQARPSILLQGFCRVPLPWRATLVRHCGRLHRLSEPRPTKPLYQLYLLLQVSVVYYLPMASPTKMSKLIEAPSTCIPPKWDPMPLRLPSCCGKPTRLRTESPDRPDACRTPSLRFDRRGRLCSGPCALSIFGKRKETGHSAFRSSLAFPTSSLLIAIVAIHHISLITSQFGAWF
jgi:hypothetical protein